MDSSLIEWAQRLQAVAQTGLAFANNAYDRERYIAVRTIATAMAARAAGTAPAALEGLYAAEQGYATPKIDVRAAVFRDGRVLLVKERSDGRWTLPGGWADVGDSPAAAAEREVREESGFEARVVKVAAVFDRNRHGHTPMLFHLWKLFFVCELLGGSARASVETEAAEFFAEDDLPPLSTGRVTAVQIHLMFEHLRDPARPTAFD
jgi:ADP-ribose pyrophosphatase YjhB (NUDIX family)